MNQIKKYSQLLQRKKDENVRPEKCREIHEVSKIYKRSIKYFFDQFFSLSQKFLYYFDISIVKYN